MAGDWIKIEHSLPGKPEVMELARLMNVDEMAVVGHLVCFWSWVDQNLSPECPAANGTKRGLDRVAGKDGFVDAMISVGWLTFDGQSVEIPNYEHHLSESAKKRAVESRKKQRQRKVSRKCPDTNGTTNGTTKGQKAGLEKRREEKSIDIYPETPTDVVIPEKMRTAKVQEYYQMWVAYLALEHPHKVLPPNSPQLQLFWLDAARMGPERFCDAVQYTAKNNWENLREREEKEPARGKSRPKADSDSEAAFSKLTAGLKKYDVQIQGKQLREYLGEKISKAASAVGWSRFSDMNEFTRTSVRKAFDEEFNGKS